MSDFETIRLDQNAFGVARLTLARADVHNALNTRMIRELRAAAATLAADTSIRVVILAAEGKSFCAGGDLGWMREQSEKDRLDRLASASELAQMLHELDNLPKPLIARVHGAAYGGGIGLISVCDVVAAASIARFALTEVRLGLIPATIAPYVIRRIGEGAARRLFLNGMTIEAGEARALGLVTIVSAAEALDGVIEAEISAFLKCAPGAIAEAKALCLHLARNPSSDNLSWTAERLADRLASEEAREGIRSFLAQETPSWAGTGRRDER